MIMELLKKEKLKDAGWNIGSVADLLNLSQDESEIIEHRLALSEDLKNIKLSNKTTSPQINPNYPIEK